MNTLKFKKLIAVMRKDDNEFKHENPDVLRTKAFTTAVRALLKDIFGPLYDVNIKHNYRDCSGFISKNGKYVYVSISFSTWNTSFLIRTAMHDRDYKGGQNHWTTFIDIKEVADRLMGL